MFIFMAYLLFTCLFIFWHVYFLRYSMFMFNTVGMFTFCLNTIFIIYDTLIIFIYFYCLYGIYDLKCSLFIFWHVVYTLLKI